MPLTKLTSAYGAFQARVLEARLRSEGFDVQLRGALDGPYALTVGELARVDVYVPVGQVHDASLVLLADEADAALEPSRTAAPSWPLWVVLAAIVMCGLAPVVRLALGG